jgi:hypothetical protein
VQIARRVYELAQTQATGALKLERADLATAPLYVELQRGWVYGVELSPAYSLVGQAPAKGEDRLRVLLGVGAHYTVLHWEPASRPGAVKRGACTPFHPAAIVRNYVDGLKLDSGLWRTRVGKGLVNIAEPPPHPSCLGQDERPLVAFLSRPRTVYDLDAAALCPPPRAARLLGFLDVMGALRVTWDAGGSPYAMLELPDGAPLDEVKRAFKRLARELHPDLHPGAAEDVLRDLERRFAEVSAAYRRLV